MTPSSLPVPRGDGMVLDAGRALLDELLAFATQEAFVYVRQWRPGGLVMWDNRPLLHRARMSYWKGVGAVIFANIMEPTPFFLEARRIARLGRAIPRHSPQKREWSLSRG